MGKVLRLMAVLGWASVLGAVPVAVQAQAMPVWVQGASPEQLRVFNAARDGLQKRLKLTTSTLNSISAIVGRDYKARGFLNVLQDLKERAELARKLQDDLVTMRSLVASLPTGPIHTDADALLKSARVDLDVGKLEQAEAKLASLVQLRWQRTDADQRLWLDAIEAQSNVIRIRRGADAAAEVYGKARSALLADTTRTSIALLLKQIEIFHSEHDSRGTRAPLDKAMALAVQGLTEVNAERNPAEYGAIQLKLFRLNFDLFRWDKDAWPRAKAALAEAQRTIPISSTESYASMLIQFARLHVVTQQYDLVPKDVDHVLALAKEIGDNSKLGEALFYRALAASNKALAMSDADPQKSAFFAVAIADNEASIKAADMSGTSSSAARINLLTARANQAQCCITASQRMAKLEQAMAEIVKAGSFWTENEDPASWYNVQTIIGRAYLSTAVQRYNLAAPMKDRAELTKALVEIKQAKVYYDRGSQFMSELTVGAYNTEQTAKVRAEIDATVLRFEQALAQLH